MHTGNVGSPFRKVLSRIAADNPDEMLVNELYRRRDPNPPVPVSCLRHGGRLSPQWPLACLRVHL